MSIKMNSVTVNQSMGLVDLTSYEFSKGRLTCRPSGLD